MNHTPTDDSPIKHSPTRAATITTHGEPRGVLDNHDAALETAGPLAAAMRLQRSREHLRDAMTDRSAARDANHAQHADGAWWEGLQALPGANIVIEAVHNWWAQHPLHSAGDLVSDAANSLVKPVAQRHPIRLVAGALVVGGVLAWSRPWRWLLKPALFAGLLPQLIGTVAAHAPVRSWPALLAALQLGRGKAAPAVKRQAPVRLRSARPIRTDRLPQDNQAA